MLETGACHDHILTQVLICKPIVQSLDYSTISVIVVIVVIVSIKDRC